MKKTLTLLSLVVLVSSLSFSAYAVEPKTAKDFELEKPQVITLENPGNLEEYVAVAKDNTPYTNSRSYTLANGKVITIWYFQSWSGGRPQFDLSRAHMYATSTELWQLREISLSGDSIAGYAEYSGVDYYFNFMP